MRGQNRALYCLSLSDVRCGGAPRRDWLADLSATHQRMHGFETSSCKQNYVRLMCKYPQFGHTLFTIRLSSLSEADAEGGMRYPPAERVTVGVNSQGINVFALGSNEARDTYTFNGARSL